MKNEWGTRRVILTKKLLSELGYSETGIISALVDFKTLRDEQFKTKDCNKCKTRAELRNLKRKLREEKEDNDIGDIY